MSRRAGVIGALLFALPGTGAAQDYDANLLGTFAIVARDPATGELGMAVQSKAFAAGNRALHVMGGVAVVAPQASANPMYGAIGLQLLQAGYSLEEALRMMVASDDGSLW